MGEEPPWLLHALLQFVNTLHQQPLDPLFMTKHAWQAVFFDFDGVIADSTEVKCQAFAHLFAPYGETVQQAVVRYHLAHGGMPRHEKLRHCYEQIAGQQPSYEEVQRAGERFAAVVFDGVVAAPLLPGVAATLNLLQNQGCPAFVVSGTPHEEMNRIVQQRDMSRLFTEVHGSPRKKAVIVADILSRFAFNPACCLFVGDALADYQAAQATGLHFLGVVPADTLSPFPEYVITTATVFVPSLHQQRE